ncbi:MAG: glycosyltransferase [Thermoanaerobaculia bacterium]
MPIEPPESPAGEPSFSLVVNTCDRSASLAALLGSLERQSWRRFEVVVVVGPTRDDTRERLARDWRGRVVVVDCPAPNLSVSRNLGLANAAGDVVAFVDDDAMPAATWLEQLAERYSDPAIAGVGGDTYLVRESDGVLQFSRGWMSALGEQQDIRREAGPPPPTALSPASTWFPRFHGTNMTYRRAALVAIGGFDESYEYLFDDADIAARLAAEGRLLRHAPAALVYHVGAPGLNRGTDGRYDLNWYGWLRAQIYFTLKNGAPRVGRRRALAAALRHARHLRSMVAELERGGEMSAALASRARAQLRRATAAGLTQGMLAGRRLPAASLAPPARPFASFRDRPPSQAPPGAARTAAADEGPPLSIALLSVDYPPRNTHGVARLTHLMARGLALAGHEVHVVTAGTGRDLYFADGAYVHDVARFHRPRYAEYLELGYPNLAAWLDHSHAAWEAVRQLVDRDRVEIVDTPLWNLDGLVTAVAGEIPVAVRIVTAMKQIAAVHGQENDETRLLADLEQQLLERAQLLLPNSAGTERALAEVYGLDPALRRSRTVRYGIEPASEVDVEAATAQARARGETRILFVGRLEKRKGILELFSAVPRLLEADPTAQVLFAGADNSRHDGFLAECGTDYATHFRRQHPGLDRRVEFLGFVDEPTLDRLYRECDLLVAPSRYESFGLVYLEAMNYAKPVIACDAGGPRDVVVDGETGRLVPPADAEALAAALLELAGDRAARERMGRAGRARLLTEFSLLPMARAFAAAYREAIAIGTPGGGR